MHTVGVCDTQCAGYLTTTCWMKYQNLTILTATMSSDSEFSDTQGFSALTEDDSNIAEYAGADMDFCYEYINGPKFHGILPQEWASVWKKLSIPNETFAGNEYHARLAIIYNSELKPLKVTKRRQGQAAMLRLFQLGAKMRQIIERGQEVIQAAHEEDRIKKYFNVMLKAETMMFKEIQAFSNWMTIALGSGSVELKLNSNLAF